MSGFQTQAAYISGAICGALWWPAGALAGTPVNINLERERHRFADRAGLTFRDMLLHVLAEKGGDFQGAEFSADTVIRVERVKVEGSMRTVHVREREISQIKGCDDLVNAEAYAGDFFGEDY